MRGTAFIQISVDKFHQFLFEVLPKHLSSNQLIDELTFHRFHTLNSFKKNFINEVLNNYYGIHYVGLTNDHNADILYKLQVSDKKLCTFFMLKYAN